MRTFSYTSDGDTVRSAVLAMALLVTLLVQCVCAYAHPHGWVFLHGDDTGRYGAKLSIIPSADMDSVWFRLHIQSGCYRMEIGPRDEGFVPVVDGRILHEMMSGQYAVVIDLSELSSGKVTVEEPCEVDSPLGVPVAGVYAVDSLVFCGKGGYMYRLGPDKSSCSLAWGGRYGGVVEVPSSVEYSGHDIPVVTIEDDVFSYDERVVGLRLSGQHLQPGSLKESFIPYVLDSIPPPLFCYPNATKHRFVTIERNASYKDYPWLFFKQNHGLVRFVRDNRTAESALDGRTVQFFDNVRGGYYELLDAKEASQAMFRGYDAKDVEALLLSSMYVAFHTFPAFDRWKSPEPEKKFDDEVERLVASRYGRGVMYSRWAAALRDGTADFGLCELNHQAGEATVVFVYREGGAVKAMGSISRRYSRANEKSGVWTPGDKGVWGTPGVIGFAYDPAGNVEIFLARVVAGVSSCMWICQKGEKLDCQTVDFWTTIR